MKIEKIKKTTSMQKIKISGATYADLQQIKQNNNIPYDEDCINMLIRYYNDPVFHLTDEFKLELIQMMDKSRVENLEEMIHVLIQYYNDPVFHLTDEFKTEIKKMMGKQKEENKVSNIEEMVHAMEEQIRIDQSNIIKIKKQEI